MRSLFIYWKVRPQDAVAVVAAARLWQAGLRLAYPGLRAALFQRTDAAAAGEPQATLMETFALPAGIPPALDAALLAAGDAALAAFGSPRRHVEVFEALPA